MIDLVSVLDALNTQMIGAKDSQEEDDITLRGDDGVSADPRQELLNKLRCR